MPGSFMSSTKRPRPVSSAGSSRRATRAPKCFAPMVGIPELRNAAADDTPKALHCNRSRSYAGADQRSKAWTMLDISGDARPSARSGDGPPLDFQAHLAALEAQGLLVRVERAINKDTELHPLVRWQFQGGLGEDATPRLPVHQRGRLRRPPLRHSGCGRRAGGLAAHLCGRHGPTGRGDRGGVAQRDRASDRAGRGAGRRRARRS